MKEITVSLPDELDARLRREAESSDVSVSLLVRVALAAHLGGGPVRELGAAGAGNSGRSDISQRIEEFLERDGFGEDN